MSIGVIYAIIVVIVLIALVLSVYLFNRERQKQELDVISTFHPVDEKIVDPNQYHLTATTTLSPTSGLVVFGAVPSVPHWTLNVDGVDPLSGTYLANRGVLPGDGWAAIITTNPLLIKPLRKRLRTEWESKAPIGSVCHIFPLIIPEEFTTSTLRFVAFTSDSNRFPKMNLDIRRVQIPGLKPVGTKATLERRVNVSPREGDISTFQEQAREELRERGLEVKRSIPIRISVIDRATLQVRTDPFPVRDGEVIAVVAVNHFKTGRASYSDVTFRTSTHLVGFHESGSISSNGTGSRLNRRGYMEAQVLVYEPKAEEVSVIETLSVHPQTGIYPHPESILPMQVFVCT